jgi:hypothetical protein
VHEASRIVALRIAALITAVDQSAELRSKGVRRYCPSDARMIALSHYTPLLPTCRNSGAELEYPSATREVSVHPGGWGLGFGFRAQRRGQRYHEDDGKSAGTLLDVR